MMTSTKAQLENLIPDPLLDAIRLMGGTVKSQKSISCPFKENHINGDKSPSGWVYKSKEDGVYRYNCASCGLIGDIYDLRDKIEGLPKGTSFKKAKERMSQKSTNTMTKAEVSPHICRQAAIPLKCSEKDATKQPKCSKIYTLKELEDGGTNTYKYFNWHKDVIDMLSVRYNENGGGKYFIVYTPVGEGWQGKGMAKPPIYAGSLAHRERIRNAKSVVICEGEGKVHALHNVGIVATTKPCGGQAPEKADWSPVYGKTVILWPDLDDKGIKYMNDVRDLLLPHCKVKMIDPTRYQLPPKGDAYDYIEMNCKKPDGSYDPHMIQVPLGDAVNCGVGASMFQHLDNIASGRIKNVCLGWPQLSMFTQAAIPGTITFLCGQGGDGKSLLATQAMQYLHENNIRWCMYELEDNQNFHLTRALAQRVKDASITEFDSMLGRQDYVRELEKEHRDWADSFGRHIWIRPKGGIDLVSNNVMTSETVKERTVAAWIMNRAIDGYRIIMVDPITAAKQSGNKWETDQKFIDDIKEVAAKHGCSILLITHPANAMSAHPTQDGMQGGKSLSRLCHTMLWLKTISQKDMVQVVTDGNDDMAKLVYIRDGKGRREVPINRELYLLKTRSGTGQNSRIGFFFHKSSLTFTEKGRIV